MVYTHTINIPFFLQLNLPTTPAEDQRPSDSFPVSPLPQFLVNGEDKIDNLESENPNSDSSPLSSSNQSGGELICSDEPTTSQMNFGGITTDNFKLVSFCLLFFMLLSPLITIFLCKDYVVVWTFQGYIFPSKNWNFSVMRLKICKTFPKL